MEVTFQKSVYDEMFWGGLSLWLLVDAINGFFLNVNAHLPISQIFKLTVLIVVFIKLCRFHKGRVGLLLLLFYVIIFSIHISLSGNDSLFLIKTLTHLSKFLLVILLYCYVKRQILLYPLFTYDKIFWVFKINLIVFVLNILLGLVGVGFASYGDIGYKGFFYAGNELSGITIVLFPFFVNYLFVKYSYKSVKFLSVLLLLFLTVGLMGTKSALIAFILSVIYIFMLSEKQAVNKVVRKFILFILLVVIGVGGYFLIYKLGTLDRWLFFFNKGGLDMLLLSGRGGYWMEERVEFFNSGYSVLLLGLGGERTVEMDIFDTLLNYGWVGIMLVYSFYLYLLVVSYKRRNINRTTKIVFFINILILFSSSISGHLLFSGMANLFIALLNTLVYFQKEEYKEINV